MDECSYIHHQPLNYYSVVVKPCGEGDRVHEKGGKGEGGEFCKPVGGGGGRRREGKGEGKGGLEKED